LKGGSDLLRIRLFFVMPVRVIVDVDLYKKKLSSVTFLKK